MQLDDPSGDAPHIDPLLRKKLIEKGLSFFRAFIDENNPDPAVLAFNRAKLTNK